MLKSIKLFLLLLLLISTVTPAAAEIVTLAWDPSPSSNVAGYNLYYQENSSAFPFNGTSLSEGASPIVLNGPDNTSQTLNIPDDGSIYYFTITAFSDAGQESSYSNIVTTEWIPQLLTPINNAAVNTVATFTWDQPPANFKPSTSIVSFDLLYGTDPNLDENTMAFTLPNIFNSSWPQINLHIILPLVMLLLLLISQTARLKRIWHPVRLGICIGIFAVQVSCGGSGGGDGGTDTSSSTSVPSTSVPSTPPATNPTPVATNVIYDITTTEYQITDLQPNTRYYWKIIAIDNWGITYESLTQSFTTLND